MSRRFTLRRASLLVALPSMLVGGLAMTSVIGTPAAGAHVSTTAGGGGGYLDSDGDKDGVSKHPKPDGDADDGA